MRGAGEATKFARITHWRPWDVSLVFISRASWFECCLSSRDRTHGTILSANMSTNKKKILVVDDDSVILKAFTLKLKASDYDVVTASEWLQTAVNAVRTQKPDAILLDINFPPEFEGVAWDGFRIMEWLRRLEEAANTPIFIVSGGDPEKYVTRARELGAVAFFRKPVAHEQLVAALRRILAEEPTATV